MATFQRTLTGTNLTSERVGVASAGMSVRSKVITQFQVVSKAQKKDLAPLSDDLVLLDSGLDSLCFAIIVARLEDEFGVDPFGENEDLEFPVTLGDFIRIYEDGNA